MNTKFLKWALPAFALTVAGSQPVEAKIPGKTSFGGRVGYQSMGLKGKKYVGGSLLAGAPPSGIRRVNNHYSGAAGDLFVSHDIVLSSFSVGIEGYVGSSTVETGRIIHTPVAGVLDMHTTIDKDYTVGARLKLGHYLWSDVLLYASLGVENTRFKVKHIYASFPPTAPQVNGSSKSYHLWGVVPGVGMQLNMHNDWRCQIDATYAMYDLSREVSGSANIASYSYHLHMRPRVFGLTIGFSRFF